MIHNLWVLDRNCPSNTWNRHCKHPPVLCKVAFQGLKEIGRGGGHHFPEVADQWQTRRTGEVGAWADKDDRATVFVDSVEDDGEEEFSAVGFLVDVGEDCLGKLGSEFHGGGGGGGGG